MEFLRSTLIMGFMTSSVVLGEDFNLPPIAIPVQKIQNFFRSNTEQKILLEMILNKKVKINGKWYKKGDYFLKYQISEIANHLVVLKKSNDILTLYITPKKSNLFKTQSHRSKETKISFSVNKNITKKGK